MIAAGQKEPSAKRCIKTTKPALVKYDERAVRKHRAPNGALRPLMACPFVVARW